MKVLYLPTIKLYYDKAKTALVNYIEEPILEVMSSVKSITTREIEAIIRRFSPLSKKITGIINRIKSIPGLSTVLNAGSTAINEAQEISSSSDSTMIPIEVPRSTESNQPPVEHNVYIGEEKLDTILNNRLTELARVRSGINPRSLSSS